MLLFGRGRWNARLKGEVVVVAEARDHTKRFEVEVKLLDEWRTWPDDIALGQLGIGGAGFRDINGFEAITFL